MIEQRRYSRSPMNQPLTFSTKGGEAREGMAMDISVGGMFVRAANPAPFGAEVVIRTNLPGSSEEHVLPGVVRWTRPDGMGVQFGLLGARETHLITEILRKHEEASTG